MLRIGHPILYKFLEFPEECGILSKKLQAEPNVYIVRFPYRKDSTMKKQRICIEYLREPTKDDDAEILEKIYAIQKSTRRTSSKYPTIEKAEYKGILRIVDPTVCSLTHIDLEEGEEVVKFKNEENLYTRKWIEDYWNYIDEMTEGECAPKHPITYADMLSQDDIERFTVSLDS